MARKSLLSPAKLTLVLPSAFFLVFGNTLLVLLTGRYSRHVFHAFTVDKIVLPARKGTPCTCV